jgi:hypothetical protein
MLWMAAQASEEWQDGVAVVIYVEDMFKSRRRIMCKARK